MRNVRLPALLALCLAPPAAAQDSPRDVTPAQVAVYRAGMDGGCRNAGHQKGDPEAKINAFCSCLIGTLDRSLSFGDWQQAFFLTATQGEQVAMQFLGPHLARARGCKPAP